MRRETCVAQEILRLHRNSDSKATIVTLTASLAMRNKTIADIKAQLSAIGHDRSQAEQKLARSEGRRSQMAEECAALKVSPVHAPPLTQPSR